MRYSTASLISPQPFCSGSFLHWSEYNFSDWPAAFLHWSIVQPLWLACSHSAATFGTTYLASSHSAVNYSTASLIGLQPFCSGVYYSLSDCPAAFLQWIIVQPTWLACSLSALKYSTTSLIGLQPFWSILQPPWLASRLSVVEYHVLFCQNPSIATCQSQILSLSMHFVNLLCGWCAATLYYA